MKTPPTLADAVYLVVQSNEGLKDLVGKPKVLHSLDVMAQLSSVGDGGDILIVGVLHDIVEDTEVGLSDLRRLGYPVYIVDAIDALTRRHQESYDEYLHRVKQNHLATRVKIADVGNNLARCKDEVERFGSLAHKYEKALRRLTNRA